MSVNVLKRLAELRKEIEGYIDDYNKAMKENDLAKAMSIEAKLRETEGEYAAEKATEVFNELAKAENPIKAAVEKHSYLVVGHRAEREEGVITGFVLVEDKVRQIDLVKFCKHCKLDTKWQYLVEKFNQLLALRAANELKLGKKEIAKISDSFYMNKLAREVEMGGTPDSNTAICKQLQMIIDAVLFLDNGKGKNSVKANNHDIAYLLMCYTKRGKKKLSVAIAKNSFVHSLVMDVMHRIVTGKTYDLEYKMVKTEEVSKPETTTAEKSETTAETVVEKTKAA